MTCVSRRTGFAVIGMLSMAALLAVAPRVMAHSASPAETAAKLTGRWKLNEELTPVSAKPGRGLPTFAVSRAPVQRGGRGGGGGSGGGQPGDASAPLMAEGGVRPAVTSARHVARSPDGLTRVPAHTIRG